jgi:hypothetical protein
MITLHFSTFPIEKRGKTVKKKIGWVERHKYLALFVFAGVPFITVQCLKLILFASFREAVTRAIGL